jgi:hypothetical protein
MSGFRGSRRLMSRKSEQRFAKAANRAAVAPLITAEELYRRQRLDAEARTVGFTRAAPGLVKKAPKTVA